MSTLITPAFDLADYMRKALRESGMRAQDAADAMELSRETVSLWLNGKRRPNRGQLIAFAHVTGVPLEWLEQGIARPERLELPTFCSVADLETDLVFWAIVAPVAEHV
jgi:transcriptional regulator with XRE-family HTH domain